MPHRPPLSWTAPVAALVAAVVVAIPVAALSGAVAPLPLGDAGPVVRWGMVLLRVVHHVAASLTIGLLLVAAFLVREGKTTSRRATAAKIASMSAGIWALSALGTLILGFGDLAGISPSAPGYLAQLWGNRSLEILTLRGLETVMLVALVPFAALARTRGALAWATVLAVLALMPLAFSGHASGTDGHETAVTALGIHLVGITVWVGGLLALAVLLPVMGPALGDALRRYSTLAAWCFVAVGLSGVLFALLTVDELADLVSPYWLVIWLKVAALAGLFVFGLMQRRTIVAGDDGRPRAFAKLATLEVILMGTAIGLGTVLGRTPPPVGGEPRVGDMAYVLTGYPMPEPFTWARLFTSWQVNWLFLLTALVALGLYLAGVAKLRRRGDSWPVGRTILWVLGWAAFIWVTSGGPSVYGRVMFSQHMIMHMALMMLVPILLVPAQAITLAYRALPARRDRTLGPREVLLAVVHSRWATIISNPVVSGVIFFGSLIVFYWTGMLDWAMRTHSGHIFMVVHFSLTGFAFVWSMVGRDPGPPKWEPPLRIIVLLATLAAHAFFGLALMQGTWLLAPEFYKTIDVPWVDDLLADQQLGGGIAWGVGEAPTVIIVLMVMVDWIRSDGRESTRSDRRADRDGDAELAAYNARLQVMHERSQR
ncbi:cytochrome c oxidase assembly protein [Ornithinimicrobium pratense]|uniref:Bifunctional copper resistance protein CopD/cytochrome c oxidase assembly protein n=1 Tax=Ornithinimicrobium pratense TaxID=2593973 RepID=A0A5J6V771_9MICO|nr:cytochrome c oxidase assembly protein [Ornithinimicrobium pratense]QFG69679.1 bifunctional copper resistance protein CopD/cytochrome c oxidase assembly protein [Ornithinimicrobium pratense]